MTSINQCDSKKKKMQLKRDLKIRYSELVNYNSTGNSIHKRVK